MIIHKPQISVLMGSILLLLTSLSYAMDTNKNQDFTDIYGSSSVSGLSKEEEDALLQHFELKSTYDYVSDEQGIFTTAERLLSKQRPFINLGKALIAGSLSLVGIYLTIKGLITIFKTPKQQKEASENIENTSAQANSLEQIVKKHYEKQNGYFLTLLGFVGLYTGLTLLKS